MATPEKPYVKYTKEELFTLFQNGDWDNRILEHLFNLRYADKKELGMQLFPYNIVLIGFMGCGKSTIAKHLQKLFAMEIVEMDQLIAEREGMSVPEIFEQYGEAYFRNLETSLLIEMQDKQNVIISCGGGVPMREENVIEMKKNGVVVLLTASPETIYERVRFDHGRPLLEGKNKMANIRAMMKERREKYEAAADLMIPTDHKSKIKICEALIKELLRKKL